MFTFYKVKVTEHDWEVSFRRDEKVTTIKNDRGALERFLSTNTFLVGYGNYQYDDKIVASILRDIDPYQTHQKLTAGKSFNLRLNKPITLDVSQELRDVELDEARLNVNELVDDLRFIEALFEKRESYFTSKFEMVKEFSLPAASVKKTRANLASEVLNARPSNDDKNRLHIMYDKRIPLHELPATIVDFYQEVEHDFKQGEPIQDLERRNLKYTLSGIEHTFGFGGLHAAKENYRGEGKYMQIDISSYYPSLILNNHFSDSIPNLEDFKKMYHTRQQLKLSKDPKEEIYKIVLNATYGAMKSKWNNLYNPRQANNIVINGQLILTHLICLLEPFCELIQSNTDGIIIKYEEWFLKSIIKLLELFEKHYELKFDVDLIQKIAQRDVNNYVLMYEDGSIKAKGRFANYNGGNYERNSLTVVDKALVDYYMYGIKPNQTVIDLWKNNKLEFFQVVTKAGKFDGMVQEIKQDTLLEGSYSSDFKSLPNVNRVFATNDKYLGSIYKVKNERETKYSKMPYTSENCLVWNEDIKKLNKRKLDLNWYIRLINNLLF